MFATRFIPLSILLLASTVGCAGLQDTEFAVYNWASAEKTWLANTTFSDQWNLSSDYRKGWKDGYRSQLNGTGCYGPPAPPPCYWSPKYRNCEGKAAVDQWYSGWRDGVAAAVCKGDHRIPIGDNPPRLLNSNRNACSVQDGCNGGLGCNSGLPCGTYPSMDLSAPLNVYPPMHAEPVFEPNDAAPAYPPVDAPPNHLPESSTGMEEPFGLIGPVGSSMTGDWIPTNAGRMISPNAGWNR